MMKVTGSDRGGQTKYLLDPGLILAVVMLAIWAYVTVTSVAPGWIHILLTAGVFLLIYRIVALADARPPRRKG